MPINHEIIEQTNSYNDLSSSCVTIVIQLFLVCAINKGKFVSVILMLNQTLCP